MQDEEVLRISRDELWQLGGHLVLELLEEGGDCGRGVDEDGAEHAGHVHGCEARDDVGARAVPKADDGLDAERVQDVDQVLAHFLE